MRFVISSLCVKVRYSRSINLFQCEVMPLPDWSRGRRNRLYSLRICQLVWWVVNDVYLSNTNKATLAILTDMPQIQAQSIGTQCGCVKHQAFIVMHRLLCLRKVLGTLLGFCPRYSTLALMTSLASWLLCQVGKSHQFPSQVSYQRSKDEETQEEGRS